MLMDYLLHVLKTVLGIYQFPFSAQWDAALNRILDEGYLLEIRTHSADFWFEGNTFSIWISNEWSAYATIHLVNGKYIDCGNPSVCRPRLRTMIRLREFVASQRRGETWTA